LVEAATDAGQGASEGFAEGEGDDTTALVEKGALELGGAASVEGEEISLLVPLAGVNGAVTGFEVGVGEDGGAFELHGEVGVDIAVLDVGTKEGWVAGEEGGDAQFNLGEVERDDHTVGEA
jgi:hypothetical protein